VYLLVSFQMKKEDLFSHKTQAKQW